MASTRKTSQWTSTLQEQRGRKVKGFTLSDEERELIAETAKLWKVPQSQVVGELIRENKRNGSPRPSAPADDDAPAPTPRGRKAT